MTQQQLTIEEAISIIENGGIIAKEAYKFTGYIAKLTVGRKVAYIYWRRSPYRLMSTDGEIIASFASNSLLPVILNTPQELSGEASPFLYEVEMVALPQLASDRHPIPMPFAFSSSNVYASPIAMWDYIAYMISSGRTVTITTSLPPNQKVHYVMSKGISISTHEQVDVIMLNVSISGGTGGITNTVTYKTFGEMLGAMRPIIYRLYNPEVDMYRLDNGETYLSVSEDKQNVG